MRMLTLSVAVGLLIAGTAIAADACKQPPACTEVQTCGSAERCAHCGRVCQCEKHCQVVCEMKEVKKHVWVVKCEDFCTSMPSCKHGCGCCGACKAGETCTAAPTCDEGCKHCDPCAAEGKKCVIPPKCGKVRTKKTLEKKEVVCKVPSYKCVVVYSCPNCECNQGCDGQQVAPEAPKAPAPAPAPGKTTIQEAPLPPAMGASFAK
jgi:hypothetical protein